VLSVASKVSGTQECDEFMGFSVWKCSMGTDTSVLMHEHVNYVCGLCGLSTGESLMNLSEM
jgi:hypothetical protein